MVQFVNCRFSAAKRVDEKLDLRPRPLKASDFKRLAVSLKRYPDTKLGFSGFERCAIQNQERMYGRNGFEAIWPSNFFDQRPGIEAWQAGQLPSGVNLYFLIEYP